MGNGKPLNTLLEHTHAQFVNMKLNNVRIVDILVGNSHFTSFTTNREFLNMDHLLQLRCNLDSYRFIMRLFSSVMLVLTLVVGVNINKIFTFIDVKLNAFYKFIHYIIKQCSGYYDAVKDCARNINKETSKDKLNLNQKNNSNKRKRSNSGSGDDKYPNRDNRKKTDIDTSRFRLTVRDLIIILRFLRNRISQIRSSPQYTNSSCTLYGRSGLITMNHVTQYIVRNRLTNVTISNGTVIPLGSLLSNLVLSTIGNETETLSLHFNNAQ